MEYFTDMRNILNHKKKTLTTASDCVTRAFRIKQDKQNRIRLILKETIELNRASADIDYFSDQFLVGALSSHSKRNKDFQL